LGDKDFNLAGGKKLSEIFGAKKFMILDFSSSGCGACISGASMINRSDLPAYIDKNAKCGAATILPARDLSAWQAVAGGADSFMGKHAYELGSSVNMTAVPKNLCETFGAHRLFSYWKKYTRN